MTVIAIDGPVGSGKSTVANAVGKRLDLPVLETGSMYRIVAAAAVRAGITPGPETADELAALASEVALEGADPAQLRTPEVNRVVSAVAAEPRVRAALVRHQREWVKARGGAVVEGRDIGTVVFPDADVKIFLTASVEERAKRRGPDEDAANLAHRDHLDSTRADSPLKEAEDALVIDSTGRSIESVVDEIVARVTVR